MKIFSRNKAGADRAIGFLAGIVLALSLSVPMLAQFTTGRLSGNVVDPSGLPLTGATVKVEQVGTGYTQSTTTGSSGEYLFPSLPVGSYQLTVSVAGFNSYVQSGITLAVGQAVTVPVQMQLGALQQKVTVVENASLVTSDSATLGQVIYQKEIVGLPLNGRYAQQLVFLVPGAANVTANYCAANCEGGVFPDQQYAKINGAGANGVSYQLDGADYNDTYINTNLPFPNPDAIQDFNVTTGNMSSIYGNAIGGVVNVTLKSGTNSIHGDAFEFFRNSVFDARNFFATSVSPLNQNQFGGDVGGPILKDRLFYFGSYQGTRFSSTNNGLISFVPSAAERTGNFSELLPGTQLVNPMTGAPYPNNQIPVNPVAAFLLKGVPLPNGPNNTLNYNGLPTVQNTDEFLGKVDYIFGKHHLSGHYFQHKYTQPLVQPPASNLLQMTGNAETLIDRNISIVDLYSISPHFLLGSYYGYTKLDGTTYASNPFTLADAGSNIAVPAKGGAGQIASMNVGIGGAFGLGGGNYGVWNRGDQAIREIATWNIGNHSIQFGGQAVRLTQPMGNTFQEGGTFQFTNDLTGNNIADFELGVVSNFIQGGGLYLNFTGVNWSTFVQDDWKVTPRFTISAGLRWDPFIPSKDSLGRVACFEPGAPRSLRYPNAPPDLVFGGKNHDPGCPESGIFPSYKNFGPRLGFAYRLTNDGKASIRGGVGYYYEPPNSLIYQQMVGVPPFAPIVNLTNVSLSDPYGSAGIANPFPASFGPRNPGPNATFPSDISFSQIQSPRLRMPMVLAWNLTVERALGTNWMVRAAYVGNDAHRLYGTGDQESGLLQLNPAIYIPGQSSEANTQQRRPYPDYGSIAEIDSGINSNYNAAQFTLEKRFSSGLSLLTNFSWSKALDDFAPQGSPYFTNTCTCGRRFDYGPSADDIGKDFKINGTYDVPRVHIEKVADAVLNGWGLTGIAEWHTGLPFTIFSGYDNSFSAIGADRAVQIGQNPMLSTGRPHSSLIQEWFNTANFAPNAIGTFGNTGKNAMRGPRFFNTDVAAIRNFHVTERLSLMVRAEFFNIFNNVNFGLPGNVVAYGPSGGFGQITGTAGSGAYGGPTSYGTAQPRILQFGFKASF